MAEHNAFPTRGVYSTKLPERNVTGLRGTGGGAGGGPVQQQQPSFGQSAPAPAFGRPPPAAPVSYAPYGQFGVPTVGRAGAEKELNLMNELSDEQKDEINESFSIFDLDRDRHLDFHELRVALRALGFDAHKNEILQIMATNGTPKPTAQRTNPPGRNQAAIHPSQMLLPQNAFMRIAAQKMLDRDPREEVERAFYLFDLERKDYINLEDMRRVTRELGETSLEEQELITMVEEFDYEGIGGVSKEAFFGICLQ